MERYETARLEISEFAEDVIAASDPQSEIIECEKITHSDGSPTTWWVFYRDSAERYDQDDEPEVWSHCP